MGGCGSRGVFFCAWLVLTRVVVFEEAGAKRPRRVATGSSPADGAHPRYYSAWRPGAAGDGGDGRPSDHSSTSRRLLEPFPCLASTAERLGELFFVLREHGRTARGAVFCAFVESGHPSRGVFSWSVGCGAAQVEVFLLGAVLALTRVVGIEEASAKRLRRVAAGPGAAVWGGWAWELWVGGRIAAGSTHRQAEGRTLDGCEHPRTIAECGTWVPARLWMSVITAFQWRGRLAGAQPGRPHRSSMSHAWVCPIKR